jgi:[acyl-carrier-protein] S-malonyltransferase
MKLAQPALLAHSLAVADAARHLGLQPSFVAGHGVGEFAAAVVAGVLDADDALGLVAERERLLAAAQRAQSGATGFVLGFAPSEVERVCAQTRQRHGYVSVAHINSEHQVLIAGNASAVAQALALAQRLGARAVPASPDAGIHSLMMATVQARLAREAATLPWRDARVPLVSNADGRPLASGVEIRTAMIGQVTRPVRWTECMNALLDGGCRHFLELGMGRVLTMLVRRHSPGIHAVAADGPAKLAAFREQLAAALRLEPAHRLAS